jgi:hypothetical protein
VTDSDEPLITFPGQATHHYASARTFAMRERSTHGEWPRRPAGSGRVIEVT